MSRLKTWQLGSYDAPFMTPTMGAGGRVPFSSTSVGYLVPLLDDRVEDSDDLQFPMIFTVVSSASCRLRQRLVAGNSVDTAAVIAALVAAGATAVAAGTDAVAHYTLANASLPTVGGVFESIGSVSYGPVLLANVITPILVRSMAEAWIQIRAYDDTATASSGSLNYACVNNPYLIGQ